MGLPASPPVTSEDSEVDGDSPPSRSTATVVQPPIPPTVQPQSTVPLQQQQQIQIPIQIEPQQEQPVFNPQLITIDERTLQLHFTPLYFGKKSVFHFIYFYIFLFLDLLDAMANIKNNNEYIQLTNTGLF
jgi:hypothetical protein